MVYAEFVCGGHTCVHTCVGEGEALTGKVDPFFVSKMLMMTGWLFIPNWCGP